MTTRRAINIRDKDDRRAFHRWLIKMGAERKNPAAWEIMRFSTSRGLLIIHEGRKGLKLNPVASEMLDRYCAGVDELVEPVGSRRRGDPELNRPGGLLAWVRSRERVTVADLVAAAGGYLRGAYLRLAELERSGDLVSEGGGPGEPVYWRAV
jgi:hypothetical protein